MASNATPRANGAPQAPVPAQNQNEVIDISDGPDSSSPAVSSSFVEPEYNGDPEEELGHALDNIKPAGSFASFNSLSTLRLGLSIQDVGNIAMPLEETQARQIINIARQAPYGRGEETVVDTSVRNTWELDTNQFELQGSGWSSLLKTMLKSVGQSLGIASSIKAELYKMLLYEKGAMFKSHTDSPKMPNMFGTLVLILPSAHQGGEVLLRHNGQKKTFHTSQVAQGFMSWYSDVHHEVCPVTLGYRWVLTYNLALADPSQECPSADNALHSRNASQLLRALQTWISQADANSSGSWCPVYKLDHNYAEAHISLADLKGRDKAVLQALQDVANKLPFRVFLAILEQQVSGSCEDDEYGYGCSYDPFAESDDDEEDSDAMADSPGDRHEIIDIYSTEHHIKKLVDVDGHCLARDIFLDPDDMLAQYDFEEGSAEEIDFEEGFSGNEGGPTVTHAYRLSGLVIVPHSHHHNYIIRTVSNGNFHSLVLYYASKSQDPSEDQDAFTLLKKLCERTWIPDRYGGNNLIEPEVSSAIVQASFRMRDREFLKKAVKTVKQGFDNEFCILIMQQVREEDLPFDDVKDLLRDGILSLPALGLAMSALNCITSPKPPNAQDSDTVDEYINKWALETLDALLDTLGSKILDKKGGSFLGRFYSFCYDAEYFRTRVIPPVEKHAKKVAFYLGLLEHIAIECRSKDSWVDVYEHLAAPFVSSINVPGLFSSKTALRRTAAPPPEQIYPYSVSASPSKEEVMASCVESHDLIVLYKDLASLKLTSQQDLAAKLSQNISRSAARINSEEFLPLWIPFLQQLLPAVLEEHAIPLSTLQYQQVFVSVLLAFLVNYVGKEITNESRNLLRPKVRCNCSDCYSLNRFLANPGEKVGRFSVNTQRRYHLHQQLDSCNIDCSHTTERHGSPYTLVVTKTFRQYDSMLREWNSRQSEAKRIIRTFPNQQLRELLGVDYPRIVHMDDIMKTAWTVSEPPTALAGLEGSHTGLALLPGPQTGQKRKADESVEVIDLTGSD